MKLCFVLRSCNYVFCYPVHFYSTASIEGAKRVLKTQRIRQGNYILFVLQSWLFAITFCCLPYSHALWFNMYWFPCCLISFREFHIMYFAHLGSVLASVTLTVIENPCQGLVESCLIPDLCWGQLRFHHRFQQCSGVHFLYIFLLCVCAMTIMLCIISGVFHIYFLKNKCALEFQPSRLRKCVKEPLWSRAILVQVWLFPFTSVHTTEIHLQSCTVHKGEWGNPNKWLPHSKQAVGYCWTYRERVFMWIVIGLFWFGLVVCTQVKNASFCAYRDTDTSVFICDEIRTSWAQCEQLPCSAS